MKNGSETNYNKLEGIVNRTAFLEKNISIRADGGSCSSPAPVLTTKKGHDEKEVNLCSSGENKNVSSNSSCWIIVMIALFVSFVAIQSSIIIIVACVIHPFIPNRNVDKLFDEFDNPLPDITRDTVPYIQDWFQNRQDATRDGDTILLKNKEFTENLVTNSSSSSKKLCLELYFREVQENIPTTSPAYVRLVLQNMGDEIYHSPSIQRALRDLLTEPQELKGLYNESQSCLSDNLPFAALTCTAIEFIPPPDLQNNMETKVFLQY